MMIPLYFLYILGIFVLFFYNFLTPQQHNHYTQLAYSFLQGNLYFQSIVFDSAYFNNHHYWPLGPFPAIILIPFVFLMGIDMKQGYLAFFFHILNLLLLYRISIKNNKNTVTALLLSFALVFSTAYLGIALTPWSWYFAQTIGFSLILLALEFYFYNRSWFLIGICIGLAYATRVSLIFTSLFFILSLINSNSPKKDLYKKLIFFLIPILASFLLVGFYNHIRFTNFFETGYSLQLLEGPVAATRDQGLWSIKHFPTNLYYLFLKLPEPIFISGTEMMQFPFLKPEGWGISILFTSPIFIWILFTNWKEKIVKISAITSFVILFTLLGSFTHGSWQFGFRYALDFYPFLFLMLLYSFQEKISYKFIIVMLISFLINLYFVDNIF